METVKSIKIKEVQTGQKIQPMVCFSKGIEAQEDITEIKGCECQNAEVYRNVYNRKSSGKISSRFEDKQEHNTNRKKNKKEILKKN